MRTNSVPSFEITGGILAGGRGVRLGGVDKAWLEVAGVPLIERVLTALRAQMDQVLINANREPERYARFDRPVVADALADFAGPLAGISAVLDAARTDWVLCVPVDAARLPPDLAQRMCAALRQNGARAAFACNADGTVPVCCLLSRALRDDLRAALAAGERSVRHWLAGQAACEVDFSEWPTAYWSLNTPDDLKRVEARLRSDAA